jgi:hypothetical protein
MSNYDPAGRLIIGLQLKRGEIRTNAERTEAVRYLLNNNLTLDDVTELYPGLLPDPPRTETDSSVGLTVTTRWPADPSGQRGSE